jgi:hypothetical protein
MPPLPEAIILVLAPFAPLFSYWVWLHCPGLAPGSDARSQGPHGDRRPAGDGIGCGAPRHELSLGLEPGNMVGSQEFAVGVFARARKQG